jgi:DNA-binding Xre family transcriptional regulator
MAVSYKKLWKLLIDKDMTAVELREKTGIAPNTITKLRRNEEVSMSVLVKICTALNANIGDIMDMIPQEVDCDGCN